MPIRPIRARVRVEEAAATCLGSLLLSIYLKAPEINIARNTRPATAVITWRMLAKRHSRPWMVGISLIRGSP